MKQFYKFNNPAENDKDQIQEEPIHFSAIIMDLNMPIMDGFEACQKILEIYEQYNDEQLCQRDGFQQKVRDSLQSLKKA